MWKKLSRNKWALSGLAGLCMVLAFSPICLVPLVFLLPFLLVPLIRICPSPGNAFRWGFFTSFVIMLGGFYWVTYVIHTFGYLNWGVSFLIFLLFTLIGALNFPVFTSLAGYLNARFSPDKEDDLPRELWYAIGLPALFTLVEFFVPKLFPWFVGHTFYATAWLNQLTEITGASFFTFAIFSAGCTAFLVFERRKGYAILAVPATFFLVAIGFSAWRLSEPEPPSKNLRVALIQANIGSLEKAAARRGAVKLVEHVMEQYIRLSEMALQDPKKPDLIVWPETAMPFSLESTGLWSQRIRDKVAEWKVPLLTGGYAESPTDIRLDYNAAFLLQPQADGTIVRQLYPKIILLAFGEYFPGGDIFPALYHYFPQVSHFARGTSQKPLYLADGTPIGVTICYEAIVPDFFRRTVEPGVKAVVNLTNDSWFGPTSEPHQHGALSVFRSLEHRVPLIRVTNTGVSFTVDRLGRVSEKTPVYDEGYLVNDVRLPETIPRTIYLRFGEWFIGLCALLLAANLWALKRSRFVSLSS